MAGSFDRAAILESFLKELHAYIPEIEMNLDRLQRQTTGIDALEEIYRRVHTIAGSAAMMDMSSMAQIATSMETIVGEALDSAAMLPEPLLALLRRSVARLRQLMDLARTNGNDSAILAQDRADYAALRGGVGPQGGAPLPRAMGGSGAPSPAASWQPNASQPMPSWQPPSAQPAPPSQPWQLQPPSAPVRPGWLDQPPSASIGGSASNIAPSASHISEHLPTAPLRDDASRNAIALTRLAETPVWQELIGEEEAVQQSAHALVQSIASLRELGRQFDGERHELLTFLDGSKDALDRLEIWAGQAMGIDLRTSPDHVRRYLPLSVLWVVTTRMKSLQEHLQESTRGMVAKQESLDEVIGHLRDAVERAGQMAGTIIGSANTAPGGGFSASIAQFSWTPAARDANNATNSLSGASLPALPPGARAELERTVREELRREVEDDVRAEVAAEVRHDEERRLRQELEIQLRRQLLAELSPSINTGMPMVGGVDISAAIARVNTPQPRRVVTPERSQETIEVFRGEAEEHLRTIADALGTLETHPHNREAVTAIRRAVHTLKGAAAITGFTAVADLSHICEDLLDRIGDGSIAISPDIISLILDTSQALDSMILGDTAEQGGDLGLLAALRPRYQVLLGETLELSTPAPAVVKSATMPQRTVMKVTDDAEHADEDIEPSDAGAAARAAIERADVSDLNVRIPLRKLDELITLFGDILVNRSIVEERMGRLSRMVVESGNVSSRLREVGLQLERTFEAALLPSQTTPSQGSGGNRSLVPPSFGGVVSGPNATPQSADFHPLEMDRYSEFHRLSRSLSEGVSDAGTLNNEIDTTMREMEVALARESRMSSSFQDALVKARLVPIASLVPRLFRAIRAIALKYGKEFEFLVEGETTEMDRSVYEDIAAPLLHLVRNAIYHGIESPLVRESQGKPAKGHITLQARYEGNQLILSVSDDGNGIKPEQIRTIAQQRGLIDSYTQLNDRELVNLIFQPGFSTTDSVTEEAGRGIGLDVVRDTMTRLRGTVEVESTGHSGTTFRMQIPISLQIQRVVLTRAGNQIYAIPMAIVEQLVQLDYYSRSQTSDVPAIEVRGEIYPLVHLATYLNLPASPVTDKTPVLLLNSGQRRWGLLVDAVSGRQEIVAKNLGPHLRSVPCVSGATVLGNGQVVLIIDPIEMLQRPQRAGMPLPAFPATNTTSPREPSQSDARVVLRAGDLARTNRAGATSAQADTRVLPYLLVVDDSPSVRRVVSTTLKNAGWDVMTARDGAEALEIVAKRTPAAILLDIEMPRMDGYELMAALRNQPAYAHLPLIVLTSRAATKHQQRALQLGADAYVVKPYQDEQLLATIAELVLVRPDGTTR